MLLGGVCDRMTGLSVNDKVKRRPLRHTTLDWIGQVFARAPFHTHPVIVSCLAVKRESPLGSCVSPIINCDGMD